MSVEHPAQGSAAVHDKSDIEDEVYTVQMRDEEVNEAHVPFIQHDDFPELTVKAVILGMVLSAVLAAANAYLGLLVGLTVSASIPASVISMAVLKLFPTSNILENNIVQTAASAGETLAAGVIFTLPGLIILTNRQKSGQPEDLVFLNYDGWDDFLGGNYAFGTLLALFGGLLGIAWSIPIRRALIVDLKPPLKFPEGVATAEVLKVGERSEGAIIPLGIGSLVGAATSLFASMGLWSSGSLEYAWKYKGLYPASVAYEVKAALIGVGYIVGPNIAVVLFIASFIHTFMIIPISSAAKGESDYTKSALDAAGQEFGETRYIGVGMMIVGAAWSLVSIYKPLYESIRLGVKQFSGGLKNSIKGTKTVRQDTDSPFLFVLSVAFLSLFAVWIIVSISNNKWGENIVFVIVIAISSFVFSAVAAYMAGLVGSSNNPISGVTICNCLLIAALSLGLFGAQDRRAPATTILLCSAVASACAISSDNMQDLKAGYILGATPWKQQLAMVLGVAAAAFVICPILEVLNSAYELGGKELGAPQATIMLEISVGILSGSTNWTYIGIGIGYGAVVIAIDFILERFNSSFRLPVLAFAVANYLGMGTMAPLFVGGMLSFLNSSEGPEGADDGVLYSAGLVAGDSLFSIILAIPVVVTSNDNIIQAVPAIKQVLWPVIFPILWLILPLAFIVYKQPFTKPRADILDEPQLAIMVNDETK